MEWQSAPITLDGNVFNLDEVVAILKNKVTPERFAKIEQTVKFRSNRIVTVTEMLHDRGNLSAVMRSAEAFGFFDFRIIENPEERFKVANRASMGTDKWLKISKYRQTEDAIRDLKDQGYRILTTDLDSRVPVQEVDFTVPSAIVLGNEKNGISSEMKRHSDLSFKIPMLGFAQSFNISVAAALSLQIARSKLNLEPAHESSTSIMDISKIELTANYLLRSVERSHDILVHSRRPSSRLSTMGQAPLNPPLS